jgi:hypothetical protein
LGRLPDEDAPLSALQLDKLRKPFQVIGTPDGEELKPGLDDADVTQQFDIDLQDPSQPDPAYLAERDQRKLHEATEKLGAWVSVVSHAPERNAQISNS